MSLQETPVPHSQHKLINGERLRRDTEGYFMAPALLVDTTLKTAYTLA